MRQVKVFSGINRATLRLVAGRLVPVVLPPGTLCLTDSSFTL